MVTRAQYYTMSSGFPSQNNPFNWEFSSEVDSNFRSVFHFTCNTISASAVKWYLALLLINSSLLLRLAKSRPPSRFNVFLSVTFMILLFLSGIVSSLLKLISSLYLLASMNTQRANNYFNWVHVQSRVLLIQ